MSRAGETELRIQITGELSRVTPRPGDVFVLHVDAKLTPELQQRIGAYLQQALGDGPKFIILERGFKLEVVAKDGAQNEG